MRRPSREANIVPRLFLDVSLRDESKVVSLRSAISLLNCMREPLEFKVQCLRSDRIHVRTNEGEILSTGNSSIPTQLAISGPLPSASVRV